MLREAAWRGIVSTAGREILTGLDSARYFRNVDRVAHRLQVDDREGRFWRAGTLTTVSNLVADPRFEFVQALPRSALFGETIANAVRAGRSPRGSEGIGMDAARLINMFVTCFDGICDETRELLPETVPYLEDVLTSIPRSVPRPPPLSHPLVSLTHDIAAAIADLLAAALLSRRGDDIADLILTVIRAAYRQQLESLRLDIGSATSRTQLSVATFAVSLTMAALFNGFSQQQANALVRVANPIGELFGWIDDIVDVEHDIARGMPNVVAIHVCGSLTDPDVLARIAEETGQRWINALRAGDTLRQDQILTADGFDVLLCDATWAWLNFPSL
ncbi:hypothetical protein [Saccharothrix luteola]|uniref:hypothetical protein n=1 Tax=Saccharothrix luteola TaxID=2893018 RepID=UPI001E41F6E2|nr:hypothetical protein [Saccharothrix luteola]MCC8245014.1 hypothetical protein [Saccharothrix luteola]